ncbi:MAG TPA: PrgI family protein [Candidatus Saccharimonadales bacterium]|nr:PrgI family protein [Candidatus Saccharimonadales bacterium]
MAVYKVIQDIEAEDKLLGPLTFRGLVYAGVAVLLGFINYKLLISPLGVLKWPFIFILLLPMCLFGVLASPLGRQQPTEVWLLARIRFFLKPRLRIWDQSGISQLVNITVPKREIKQLTKNLSQSEVASRLQALATTLDSRGWAVKNVSVNLSATPSYLDELNSDRLVDASNVVQEVPEINVRPADDILDAKNNTTAQNFQTLINQAEVKRREELQARVEAARKAEAEAAERARQTQAAGAAAMPSVAQAPAPQPTAEEEFFTKHAGHDEKIHDIRQAQSLEDRGKSAMLVRRSSRRPTRVTRQGQTAKLELAQSGNDLSVASIARLANQPGASQA